MITDSQKQQIADRLRTYSDRYESQNKASRSLRSVSGGTISQILNSNWEQISDEMWRNIASQVGYLESEWQLVETRDMKMMTSLLDDARINANVFAVTGDAGSGKSVAMRQYAEKHKRIYLLQCAEYWNRKMFLQELLSSMGRDYSGYTVAEMMYEVVRSLKVTQNPVIIMDEADKLNDHVLYFFITLYNHLEDRCGIVMCATDHLEKRIKRGLKLNKKGYKEIYSRIARRFINLKGPGSTDISAICMANGIAERDRIRKVVEESEYDLRRVRRAIHALRQTN
ncbi:MAG TPA: ATP-binding protein [Bacteroidales bacterium]|nr:ATP-binding protein [Bacteroidales bacterium]HSA43571.1 ATP-binding protein [Bacteroidales bacterium]